MVLSARRKGTILSASSNSFISDSSYSSGSDEFTSINSIDEKMSDSEAKDLAKKSRKKSNNVRKFTC